MSTGKEGDGTADGRSPQVAEGMLEEARQSAAGDAPDVSPVAAEEPEPGTVADTGQPAGTADAHAAGVMDTADEDGA